jgi:O-antigen ligase/tetratricopeptide (TPR) repeat protein
LRILDRIFQSVLFGLIFLAPLAFGSVYPWAYRVVEAACFGLFALWMLKLRMLARVGVAPTPPEAQLVRSLGVPLGLLLLYIASQSLPLPPAALRVISPATYLQYRYIYSNWPEHAPGADLVSIDGHKGAPPSQPKPGASIILPTTNEVIQGAPIPFSPPLANSMDATAAAGPDGSAGETKPPVSSLAVPAMYSTRWRPLTIAWPLTNAGLIGAFAVAALLFAVTFYPAGDQDGSRTGMEFTRISLIAVLVSGLIITMIGLIQWATWNGKILWTMVPLDWGAPDPSAQRASGPFVNPDHFAGYLAMIFPLMLSEAIFGGFPARSNADPAKRISCGFAAFLIFIAVALSQSRAGWMGLAIGTVSLFLFAQSRSRSTEDSGGEKATVRALRTSLAILAAMVVLALMFVGGRGRDESTTRLGVTVSQGSLDLQERLAVWVKTPAILREFPLFGVGLGAWPEVFFRFQPAPRSDLLYNAAHNDYLELVVDMGLVGIALLGWLVVRVAARLRSALHTLPDQMLPTFAAMVAGLIVMAAIEFFDFDLQVPANLVLFALLAGLALRMSIPVDPPEAGPRLVRAQEAESSGRVFYLLLAGTIGLGIFAMMQTGLPYPYDIATPGSLSDARSLLLSYPYNPDTHRLTLARFGDSMEPAMRSRWIANWAWLDPTDPHARDIYAQDLLDRGRRADALRQITESVFVAPLASWHFYLGPRIVPWLPDDEKRAINDGLGRAVGFGFVGSVETLGDFYKSLGKSKERAAMLTQAAERENDRERRARYLRDAADAYMEMGQLERAGEVLRTAIDADPGEADNYTELIARVLVPLEAFEQVQRLISEGIDQGADPCQLAQSVVKGAQARGRVDVAEQALDTALKADSTSYECTHAMGGLYLATGRNARAVLLFHKATELRPDSVEAYLDLATAADRNYDYSTAEAAYNRAASLAPGNREVAEQLAGFKRKLTDAAADSDRPHAMPADIATPDAQASAAADSDAR